MVNGDLTTIERLFKYLEFKKIPPTRFEKDLGLNNGMLSKLLRTKSTIKEQPLNKIVSSCKDLNPLWLILGKGDMINEGNIFEAQNSKLLENDNGLLKGTEIIYFKGKAIEKQQIDPVPVYDVVATAGLLTVFEDNNTDIQPVAFIRVPNLPKADCFIYAQGDSMYPILCNGDNIAIKEVNNRDYLLWGEMYLIIWDIQGDLQKAVKYVKPSDKEGHIKLSSHNKNYNDFDIPKDSILKIFSIKATIRINNY